MRASGRCGQGERGARSASRKGEGIYDPEVFGRTDEKNRDGTNLVPVLKPTQVGEMSILRRSRERWRRNSATWLRNFGIRSAPGGVKAPGGRSEKGLATVY